MSVFLALDNPEVSGLDIYQIDSGDRYTAKEPSMKHLGLKTLFGSTFMYKSPLWTNGMQSVFNISSAAGGLSTVWGAGIRLYNKEQIELFIEDTAKFYESASQLLHKIPWFGTKEQMNLLDDFSFDECSKPFGANSFKLKCPNDFGSIKFFDTPLAVETRGINACRSCGVCMSGCPYGSILDSSKFFDSLVYSGKLKRQKGIVTNLRQVDNSIEVTIDNAEANNSKFIFDRVYLCAGAIGTPILLLKSKLIESPIIVKESQVFYFVGLYRRRKSVGEFSLSQKTITDENRFSASIYSCNENLRNVIGGVLFGKIPKLRLRLPKFLDKFVFLGIGFIDSDYSGSIEIAESGHSGISVEVRTNKAAKRQILNSLLQIAKRLYSDGLYIIPVYRTLPAGRGFHNGGGLPLNSNYLNVDGSLRGTNNVYPADTSILPKIFAGPHTFNSMVLNHMLIRKSFN